jgi:arabinose-5-phosphate isomerase
MDRYLDHLEKSILGLTALRAASQSVEGLDLGPIWRQAIKLVLEAPRVHTTGIGKSGHIARKVASTMSSLGTPAYHLSLADAIHGDLGSIQPNDVVMVFSNSGMAGEIRAVIDHCRIKGCPIIGITGRRDSILAKSSTVPLVYPQVEEYWYRAPTTSCVMQLVIGDVIAVTVSEQKGYGTADFHSTHPGGAIGGLNNGT